MGGGGKKEEKKSKKERMEKKKSIAEITNLLRKTNLNNNICEMFPLLKQNICSSNHKASNIDIFKQVIKL